MDVPGGLVVHHVGLGTRNPPGRTTDRPRGVTAWQINLFHHPVLLRWAGAERRVEAPAVVCFAPGQPQWYRDTERGFADDWLTCSGPLGRLLARHGVPTGVPIRLTNPAAVEACLRQMHSERTERLPFADEALSDLLRALVRLLARGRLADPACDPRRGAIAALRAVLRDRCAESWSVARMAAEAGLGPHRFAVLYRRFTGTSPLHDLTGFRILRAQSLLRSGDRTVKAVAADCGFTDPLYFSRVFRHWTGVAPSASPARIL